MQFANLYRRQPIHNRTTNYWTTNMLCPFPCIHHKLCNASGTTVAYG